MMTFSEDKDYATYPMNYIYEFADIIQGYVNSEIAFWNYNIELASVAVAKFSKISLLHIYIYCQLHNFHNRNYFINSWLMDQDLVVLINTKLDRNIRWFITIFQTK